MFSNSLSAPLHGLHTIHFIHPTSVLKHSLRVPLSGCWVCDTEQNKETKIPALAEFTSSWEEKDHRPLREVDRVLVENKSYAET